jgi:hypothetical protein
MAACGPSIEQDVHRISHVHLLTTGHSFAEHVRPMITGYDKVELTPAEEAYREADEPGRIRS